MSLLRIAVVCLAAVIGGAFGEGLVAGIGAVRGGGSPVAVLSAFGAGAAVVFFIAIAPMLVAALLFSLESTRRMARSVAEGLGTPRGSESLALLLAVVPTEIGRESCRERV